MQPIVPGTDAASSPLPGDVLIVEDDPLLALDFSETLTTIGVASVRTASNAQKAIEMIAARAPDFVLLDVDLVREKSFSVAEHLESLGIPFAFVTGYVGPSTFPPRFARYPVLIKPYRDELLREFVVNWRALKQPPGGT